MVYLSKNRAVVSANDWACIVTACCDICLEHMCPLADCNYRWRGVHTFMLDVRRPRRSLVLDRSIIVMSFHCFTILQLLCWPFISIFKIYTACGSVLIFIVVTRPFNGFRIIRPPFVVYIVACPWQSSLRLVASMRSSPVVGLVHKVNSTFATLSLVVAILLRACVLFSTICLSILFPAAS